ncbi:hypothetical protein [Arenimonas malthae]|uniref:hypothetical protein n=1 Tax=Arenimonas malthae TaxID=354197 RepID=UPI0012EC2141|nr:hypothetical protein [Arenimonas malthae]
MTIPDDKSLWDYGKAVANYKRRKVAWELDFLRGMHQGSSLSDLAFNLSSATGQPIQLTSVWMDKHAWVSWYQGTTRVNKRELADLAVIVRKRYGGEIAKWMWLIQGKRTKKLLDTYGGTSTPFELDLLHRMPDFWLNGSQKAFKLKGDFPDNGITSKSPAWAVDVSTPWTFLDFDADASQESSAYSNGYSPVAPRWPGATPKPQTWAEEWQKLHASSHISISSYFQCLCSIINSKAHAWQDPTSPGVAGPAFLPGAPVDAAHFPEWHDLYQALIATASNSTSGHAVTPSNQVGSVLQVSQLLLDLSWGARIGPHAYAMLPVIQLGTHRPLATVAQATGYSWLSTRHDALANFNQLISRERSHPWPRGFEPPEEPAFENDEPGGMLTLFVDAFGEESVRRD